MIHYSQSFDYLKFLKQLLVIILLLKRAASRSLNLNFKNLKLILLILSNFFN